MARLTQLRSFGAFTGARYGGFGRHPVGRITQWRAYGTGARYGSFAGRTAVEPEPEPEPGQPAFGFRRVGPLGELRLPIDLRRFTLMQIFLEEEEVLLATIAAAVSSGLLKPSKDDSR